ncbi:MAG: hypothetical protein NTX48_07360 [Planctomycetales bacterium]|nr:hypothetical protein [Planctomycetales bacterium]
MDFDVTPFTLQDMAASLKSWLLILSILGAFSLLLGMLLCVARNGAAGIGIFFKGLLGFLNDVGSVSPRRIRALTSLTLKEAIRRKALLVFAVFALLLMFAGWFLTNSNERAELQVGIHIAFILQTISWIMMPVVFFLSCWSLPEDVRIHSLHTVVTKPARRIEIVLGRIIGMGIVTLTILAVMGGIGYLWIVRQLPTEAKKQLTCRVPVFGHLQFINPEGQPSLKGINVGDVWDFRSHIAGNSRSRGVFVFDGIDDSTLVTGTETGEGGSGTLQIAGLRMECRFEAFRTIKGSESSVRKGVTAQYTLSNNPREEAFGLFSQSETLRPLADALRDAQFRTAANRMEELATKVAADGEAAKNKQNLELMPADYMGLQLGSVYAAGVMRDRKDVALESAATAFQKVAERGGDLVNIMASNAEDKHEKIPGLHEALSQSMKQLASLLDQEADTLHEHLPKLEVVLPSFHVSEYHEGAAENVKFVPRTVRFSADAETQCRLLARLFEMINETGQLVEGAGLKSDLAAQLESEGKISVANANLVVEVLTEQLASGALKVDGSKLVVADGQRWFHFFDSLIQKDLLISAESEGWMIERDLIKDLTHDGYLRVEVACLNDQMYLGMARPDLFLRKPDRDFLVGYGKALVSTSLMMLLIIVLGVTVSCIVKGPVALFFTFTFFIVGQFFHEFMRELLYNPAQQGMGAIASAVMTAQHRNPQVGMDVSEATQRVVQGIDAVPRAMLWGFSEIVPDFSVFNSAAGFVENGFDVPFFETVVPAFLIFLGFLIPCVLIASALLKFRELESK